MGFTRATFAQVQDFGRNLMEGAELIGVRIPVVRSDERIDESNGPNCEVDGEHWTPLETYFQDQGDGPQPVQVKVEDALTTRQKSDWCSFAEAEDFLDQLILTKLSEPTVSV